MAKQLYHDRSEDAPKDALRLAEEFRIYLGQAALVEFMREQVPDASWRPGRLHKDLMALPWADVLTTNYDTLLERASDRHKVVLDAADLAQVRGPRVIKLHGSVNANTRLVIAEEDYRTYPTCSAAFVNTARQVFLENELCLVGFSGDDPNFLQWSGWVRDHLGESARRIYLVGSLGLSPPKRRLLESRNIAPIDFAPLTDKLERARAESRACELFLNFLASRKPRPAMDWEPAQGKMYDFIPSDFNIVRSQMADTVSAAALLKKLGAVWQTDMDSCPDWFVMPKEKRETVGFGTSRDPWNYVKAIDALDPPGRASILVQAVWRNSATLRQLDNDVELAAVSLATGKGDLRGRNRFLLLRTLLREARHNRNEDRFRQVEAMLTAEAPTESDAHAELIAQRLLWARDGLDYAAVSSGAAALEGPDPMWRILRAALHCECGETELAKPLIAEARADLADRERRDTRSVSVASRRAWADVFGGALRMSETWISERAVAGSDSTAGYDAEDEIDKLRREVRYARLRRMEEPQGYQPRFGPGTYEDHGRTVTFTSAMPGQEAKASSAWRTPHTCR